MKTCLFCQATKPFAEFSLNPKGRGGLHPWCSDCVREYNRARYRAGEAPSRYVRKSQATLLPYTPPDKNKTERADSEPGYRTAEKVWRKLSKTGAVPSWIDFRDTVPFYALAQKLGFTVDHIVPVQGKDVCGLHVPWNLQLLTRPENSRKGRKFSQPF